MEQNQNESLYRWGAKGSRGLVKLSKIGDFGGMAHEIVPPATCSRSSLESSPELPETPMTSNSSLLLNLKPDSAPRRTSPSASLAGSDLTRLCKSLSPRIRRSKAKTFCLLMLVLLNVSADYLYVGLSLHPDRQEIVKRNRPGQFSP